MASKRRMALEAIANADNYVQRLLRDKLLGLSNEDINPKGIKSMLGRTVFSANPMATPGPYRVQGNSGAEDIASVLAARALQLGAISGVGGVSVATADAIRQLIAAAETEKTTPLGMV